MPLPFVSRSASIVVAVSAVVVAGAVGSAATQSSAAGNSERGKAVFEKCAACHSLDDAKPGADTTPAGPSLKGIVGKTAASRDDFRYSPAMTRSGVVWSAETLSEYVADPQAFMRGNRMSFAGIPDKAERDDLIAFLLQATRVTQ